LPIALRSRGIDGAQIIGKLPDAKRIRIVGQYGMGSRPMSLGDGVVKLRHHSRLVRTPDRVADGEKVRARGDQQRAILRGASLLAFIVKSRIDDQRKRI